MGDLKSYLLPLRLLGLGWVIVTAILLPLGLGIWGDSAWGTGPWLALLGMVVGLLAAALSVYRLYQSVFGTDKKP